MHISMKLFKLVNTLKAFHVSGGVWAFFNFSHRVVPSNVVFIMSWNSLNSNVPLPDQHKKAISVITEPQLCLCCSWELSSLALYFKRNNFVIK